MIAKRIILALIVAALVAIPMTTAGAGQNEDAPTAKASKVGTSAKTKVMTGSWIGSVSAPGLPPFKFLMTFTDDGGLIVSQATIVPFSPPIEHAVFSAAHGEWNMIRNAEFAFTFVALIHDENATFLGTSKVNGTLQVNDAMDTLTGTAHACDLDPDGNPFFCFDATLQADRIRVGS